MADLGSDFSCVLDLDANLSVVDGRLMLAQAVVRRWITEPGGLFYDDEYGAGLLLYLNDMVDRSASSLSTALENEALKDERVEACAVQVSFDLQSETLTVRGQLTDSDGPFRFVLDVSAVTTQLLMEET